MAGFRSSKLLPQGKRVFLSCSSEMCLRLVTLCMLLDYLYFVGALHRHLQNLRMSFRTTLQSQTNWKEGSLTLSKMSKFVSLSCLLWQLSVSFFFTNGKYKACSVAWAGEFSAIFEHYEAKTTQQQPTIFIILGNFEVFFASSNLQFSHINVQWATIQGVVSQNLSVSKPVYVSSYLYQGHIQDVH